MIMITSMKTTSNTDPKTKTSTTRRVSFGDGLFRYERPGGSSSWVCRVQKQGHRRDFGLGSCSKVSLAEARERAREVRSQMEMGLDPQFERRKLEAVPTFKDAAHKVFDIHSKTWRNGKHHAQWMRTLEMYVFPSIGKHKVDKITGPMIRDVLAEIWLAKPETARRVRQRIGAVLDWAYASGYRETEAPMRAISKGLPRQPRKDGHFPAMPYEKVSKFIQKLRARESFSRLALEFAIYTAARSGEVRGMTWDEVDMEEALWTLPKERMKAFREHVVPLTPRPLRILRRCAQLRLRDCQYVFPGIRSSKPLSDMTLSMLMKEMGQPYTPHGFRSSFRDWVSEETNHPSDVAEAALAHTVANKTEAAYRRGNLLEKRRVMMAEWAAYCDKDS
ncbi:tyrosine-type recombinase/integrase [Blastomonas aquatica]|nr:site-specific integrase [Blastomonas aquatica]